MSAFESIVYGFVSGFAEFLPVSTLGHQSIMFSVFGIDTRDPLLDLLIHISILMSLIFSCKPMLAHLRREQIIASRKKGRRRTEHKGAYDLQIIKTAGFPLILCMLLYIWSRKFEFQLPYVAAFFVINGVVLIIPEYIRQGNKDARFLTALDGLLLGSAGALSVFPGISHISTMQSYSLLRGVDRNCALNWILALTIPMLAVYMGFDVFNFFAIGLQSFSLHYLLCCILSSITAFIGGYLGIVVLRFMSVRTDFSGFAYYSWGAAFFTFILYLIV